MASNFMPAPLQNGRFTYVRERAFLWQLDKFTISHGNGFQVCSPPVICCGVECQIELRKEENSFLMEAVFHRLDEEPLPPVSFEFRLMSREECVSVTLNAMRDERAPEFVRFDVDLQEYLLERRNSVRYPPLISLTVLMDDEWMPPESQFVSRAIQTEAPVLSPETKAMLKLQDDFKKLILNKKDSDIIIKVQGEELPAHKAILRARSPVFNAMLKRGVLEEPRDSVSIEDCDPNIFHDFLTYVYCGTTKLVCEGNVCQLYTVSDKYEVLGLKAYCIEFMKTQISIETFCDFLTVALKHQEGDLVSVATDFFCANALEIGSSEKWKIFCQTNQRAMNDLHLTALLRRRNNLNN